MRRRTALHLLGAALLLTGLLGMAAPVRAEGGERKMVVVVNRDNPVANITLDDLRDLYFGKRRFWAHGERIQVADLVESKLPEEKSAFAHFAARFLGKEIDAVKSYWIKIIFSGAGQPPKQLRSAAEVIDFVAASEGGVGYLYADDVTPAVKVVAVSRPEE
ncbi:MAG: hypothetical protein HQK87_04165 [Nitrospinae bacterium]|nr:hypothetical protein [Nitrospinota bacterium]